MTDTDLIEGKYLADTSSVISEYEDSIDSLKSLLGLVQNDLQVHVEQVEALINAAKHDISGVKDAVSEKMSKLIEVLGKITDDLEKLNTDDPTSVRGLAEAPKEKINWALSILEDLIDILKKPLHKYIAAKYSEYLGLNEKEVLNLIENLNSEDLQEIKSRIDGLIAQIVGDYKAFRENVRKIFTSIGMQRRLDINDLKGASNYALNVCKLLEGIGSQDETQKIELITSLLSRISNYSALSDLGSHKPSISSLVDELSENLEKLATLYNIDISELYNNLYDQIGNSYVPLKIDDIIGKIEGMKKNTERLIKVKETQKSLEDVLSYIQERSKEMSRGSNFYLEKDYEEFKKTLENYYNCYTREIPNDAKALAECIYNRECAKACPEDLTTVRQGLSNVMEKLSEILGSCKVITQKFCEKEANIVSDINKLFAQSDNDNSDTTDLRPYFEYMLGINSLVHRVTECVMGATPGLEIDITELDVDVIKAIIEVLKARNIRIVLKGELK